MKSKRASGQKSSEYYPIKRDNCAKKPSSLSNILRDTQNVKNRNVNYYFEDCKPYSLIHKFLHCNAYRWSNITVVSLLAALPPLSGRSWWSCNVIKQTERIVINHRDLGGRGRFVSSSLRFTDRQSQMMICGVFR